MGRKITKDDFENIAADAITDEMKEFTDKMGGGSATLAIGLMGASITYKIRQALFQEDNEIEIVTDKE